MFLLFGKREKHWRKTKFLTSRAGGKGEGKQNRITMPLQFRASRSLERRERRGRDGKAKRLMTVALAKDSYGVTKQRRTLTKATLVILG